VFVPAEFSEINAALVSQLIASQFPQWAHLPVKPVAVSGWDNRTFHLGPSMSVRLPSAEGYVAQVEKEHRWLPKLAPLLPLPIPVPLAKGAPGHGYPWPWSVYRWLEGENATLERIADLPQFAISLAEFLLTLQRIDATDGPPAGVHNFFRGGPLTTYDAETRATIETLRGEIDADAATKTWNDALETSWQDAPVWVHGDVAVGNLLVKNGQLCTVIDFGCCAVGDPACDLVMAWTFFTGEGREAFRSTLGLDRATWARARGWALWKALITLAEHIDTNSTKSVEARRVIAEVLADHKCNH
jgi:aminoglycoside phosphotransferase (APT) family kinase protein